MVIGDRIELTTSIRLPSGVILVPGHQGFLIRMGRPMIDGHTMIRLTHQITLDGYHGFWNCDHVRVAPPKPVAAIPPVVPPVLSETMKP